ncbi:MAG: XdhC family protein [Phycisphaerales bacterium JB039]
MDTVPHILASAIAEAQHGRACALCIVTSARGSTPQVAGAMMLVRQDGSIEGTIGGGFVEAQVICDALEASAAGTGRLATYDLTHIRGKTIGAICGGVMEIALAPVPGAVPIDACEAALRRRTEGEDLELMFEVADGDATRRRFTLRAQPPPRLLVIGAGHCGQALANLAVTLDFDVTIIDDRAELTTPGRFDPRVRTLPADPAAALRAQLLDHRSYIAIVTRSHQQDYESLLATLSRDDQPGYVGLIGSRRKRKMVFDDLRAAGVSDRALDSVSSPIGIDIGAQTVQEIAVSICAELIRHRRSSAAAASSVQVSEIPTTATRPG